MSRPIFLLIHVLGLWLGQPLCCAADTAPSATLPARLSRTESFLGIHFDFHAGPDCCEIGKNTTPAMIDNIIDQVHPDYLQIDCKGHPGLSSYPTKVGNQAPGFVGDPLRIWRDVTARRGVALYMHYSGVWDAEAIRRHPDWAAVGADGKPNGQATSLFSPYADQLLIPQLRELAGTYGVDGAWIDGECWGCVVDYSEPALKAFRAATGIQQVPRKPDDPHWFEFISFQRESFREYLRHYIAEVKRTNPTMQLCSNWAFSDHMPEPVSAPVDFLSGDFSPEDSVNSARFSARCLARQGKPWDLMAWSFTHNRIGRNQKSAIQLQQEAAVVLSLGGGFQAYFQQRRDGSVREEQMPVMAAVAQFCRARQAFCHHATQVPQVAVLYSTASHYRTSHALFRPGGSDIEALKGVMQALLETQNSVEVLSEHHLAGHMSDYPLIVVPECEYLDPPFKDELVAYTKDGGNLLLIGPQSIALFQAELGITPVGAPAPAGNRHLVQNGEPLPIKGPWQNVQLGTQTTPFATLQSSDDPNSAAPPAASIAQLGRGHIAGIYFSLGHDYLSAKTGAARQFMKGLVRSLFPQPMVEVDGSADVDVTVNRLGRKLAINLVNTTSPQMWPSVFDALPPIGPLTVTIRQSEKPAKITLQPAGQTLDFTYHSGEVHLTIPQLEIHEVIVVE